MERVAAHHVCSLALHVYSPHRPHSAAQSMSGSAPAPAAAAVAAAGPAPVSVGVSRVSAAEAAATAKMKKAELAQRAAQYHQAQRAHAGPNASRLQQQQVGSSSTGSAS